jgi:aminopeptidase YwaD
MNKIPLLLLTLAMLPFTPVSAQKRLKKADRVIVANVKTHVSFLNGAQLAGRKAGSEGEKLADEYIIQQFTKHGLKPRGENAWLQAFTIYDGKEIKPATHLKINDDELQLYTDYFPFSFSANKSEEAAVAIALAENGVPWFKDIGEMINEDDSVRVDTFQAIYKKAKNAAAKGASALIVYNRSGGADLGYNRFDSSDALAIPVIYITKKAFKKYSSDESAVIDLKLNVELEARTRTGNNVIGYTDNGADSTIVATASLGEETGIAGLIEVARLLKSSKPKNKNYLFIAYCSENDGSDGEKYFREHPSIELQKIRSVNLDSIAAATENPKELNLVKRTIEIIKH